MAASGLGMEHSIYVFDSFSENQSIYKVNEIIYTNFQYNIYYDVWETIQFQSSGFSIPRTINSSVFQFDKTQIMFLNGMTQEPSDLAMHYYMYDIEKGTLNYSII